jgi:hypothetical protein
MAPTTSQILGNQEESFPDQKIGIPPDPSKAPNDGTKGRTDKDDIPLEWCHAPYTVKLADGMGKIVAELGRVQASSQASLKLMEKMLVEELRSIDSQPDEGALKKRHSDWSAWWHEQKAERYRLWYEAKQRNLEGKKKRKPKT